MRSDWLSKEPARAPPFAPRTTKIRKGVIIIMRETEEGKEGEESGVDQEIPLESYEGGERRGSTVDSPFPLGDPPDL